MHHIERLMLADMIGMMDFLLIASFWAGLGFRNMELEVIGEEVLVWCHTVAEAAVQLLARVVRIVTIEVPANSVLAVSRRFHDNLSIDKVRPTIDLYVVAARKRDVHHFVCQEGHGIIDELSMIVESDRGRTAMGLSEPMQDGMSVAGDPSLHTLHLDLVVMNELTTHNDRGHR